MRLMRAVVRLALTCLTTFAAVELAACGDFPGADGRYATHDRGASNRGEGGRGLPITPYQPK